MKRQLLQKALAVYPLRSEPYPHLLFEGFFTSQSYDSLHSWLSSSAPWKRHEESFYDQMEVNLKKCELPNKLSWLVEETFLKKLSSAMECWFDVPLSKAVDVCAHKLIPGQGIGVHTDRPELGFETHRLVINLNNDFEDEDGGHLAILRSRNPSDVYQFIRPLRNHVFAFEMSENSFHAVTNVRRKERFSVVFSFTHVANTFEHCKPIYSLHKEAAKISIPKTLEKQLQTLGAHKAQHSRSTLLSHLMGTYRILKLWGCEEYLCLAGLFHSIYGLDKGNGLLTRSDRSFLKAIIGEHAESLVDIFSGDRRWAAITKTTPVKFMSDLIHIELANYFEQATRCCFDGADWVRYGNLFKTHQKLLGNEAAKITYAYFGI